MKESFIYLSAALVSLALVSCNKEMDSVKTESPENNIEQTGSIPFVLKAKLPETKTTLNPSNYEVSWADGDIIYAVTADEEWGSGETSTAATAASFTYSGSSSSFSTEATITDGEHTFFFVYEPSSQVKYHRSAATTFSLQATQTQNCSDATAHIKQNDVLAGKLTAETPSTLATVNMAHVNTLMQFNITNNTGNDVTLSSFDITFDGASIAGIETISFAGSTATASITSSGKDKITVNLTNGSLAAGQTLPIYFVMAPLSGYTGDVTINVYNSEGGYFTMTNTFDSAISFAAGSYNTTTVSISAWVTPTTFTRINSLSEFTDGDYKYVIVGQQADDSFGLFTYGTPDGSNRLPYAEAYDALPATTLQCANNNAIWTIAISETGTKTATIYNAENDKYLKASSGLSFVNAATATKFTVTSEGNLFAFAQGSNYLGVNKSSNFWRDYASGTVYASSGKVLALYRYWEDSTLESIIVSGAPPTEFHQGDAFIYDGLIVRAFYSNGKTRVVTPGSVTGPNMDVIASNVDVTVSYTEGGVNKTATYKVNINAPSSYTVSWVANGTLFDSSTVGGGETLTLPATNPSMADNVFIGWTLSTSVNSDGSSISYAKTGDAVDGDVTYYAVFAVAGSAASKTLNVKTYASANSWTNGQAYSSATVEGVSFDATSSSGNDSKYYDTGSSWRFYTADTGVRVTTPVGSILSSVDVTFANDGCKIASGWTPSSAETSASPAKFTPLAGTITNTVEILRKSTGSGHVRFQQFVVNYTPYSAYKLTE